MENTMLITVTKRVLNPNIIDDAIKFMNLQIQKDELKKRIQKFDEDTKLQFNAFLDRFELTNHLEKFSRYAQNNKFKINGEEINGIDADISSLRIYLLLTCIDICVGKKYQAGRNFKDAIKSISVKLREELKGNLSVNNASTITRIADCFWKLRCGYTHSGFRFHHIKNVKIRQVQLATDDAELELAPGFDLIAALKKTVSEIAQQRFGLV
jgi:hypothetical protein